ncbi:MAG: sterol desaturase family protein [Pseudomonadota bacterium]
MTFETLQALGTRIEDAFFIIGSCILLIEVAECLFKGRPKGRGLWEMAVSFSTQIPTLAFDVFIFSGAYVLYYIIAQSVVPWAIPVNGWTAALAIIVADFFYYWEHRTAHQIRLFWTQHAVHHSSRDYNIATALRFGPMESVWSLIAHLPMVFLGFPPELIFFGILSVLAYQTWLHTQLIGRLGIVELIFNTPSHHRVHHGCDAKYLDKNYAGVLIIWDRIFGTFQVEEETPCYGLKREFNSQNPVRVWFSEVPGLWRDLRSTGSFKEGFMLLFRSPNWRPNKPRGQQIAAE